MALVPPPANQLLEVGTGIYILVFGREIVEDFGGGMDARGSQAYFCFRRFAGSVD